MGKITDQNIKLYQLVCLAGPPTLWASWSELDPSVMSQLPWLGMNVACCILLQATILFGSAFSSHVKAYVGRYALLSSLVLITYYTQTVYATDVADGEFIGALLTVGLVCLIYHQVGLVIAWAAGATAIVLTGLALVDEPQRAHLSSVAEVCAVAFVCAAMRISMLRTKYRLQQSQALMQAIFDDSVDALIYGDSTKPNPYQVNSRAKQMFGTDNIEQLYQLIKQAYFRVYPDHSVADMIAHTTGTALWQDSFEFHRASGEPFYGRIAVSRLQLSHRNIGLIRISDISDLRAQQVELTEAKDMAEAAIEVRSRFLANMSHEIRTPMNGVIGMTSLLLNTKLDEEQSSYVETIRASGESLLTIINEILDFSKIEADQIQLEQQDFDLEHCVADALDIVSPLAASKGLELVLDLPPDGTSTVRGDVQRLRQVLVNLLSNAIKFTEQGEVVLKVRLDPPSGDLSEQPWQIHFAVSDTGIGIATSKIHKLFDAFTQADSSTTRRYGGTGLGLSISRSLVRLMGGDIYVDSEEGSGSTFSFFIESDAVSDSAVASAAPEFEGLTTYAVDDNVTNRQVLAGTLEWFGLSVQLFDSPRELMAACEVVLPDLLISDMAMPDMDGVGLSQALREKHGEQLAPMILLTSLDRGDVDWDGFSSVLRKPVRPSDLLAAITKALARKETPQAAAPVPQEEPNSWDGARVLVAEDNAVNQTVARQMFKKLGVMADIAANGREAVAMVNQHRYKLVFMDVQMPEIDGLEATRLIRLEDGVQPYIVAMTANVRAEDQQDCLDAGMDDFVGKPIRLQDLRQALERAQSVN